ncbi:MAG: sodium:proton antiporter, partial [Eubacteriales bacterium]|nr:sodium:proton antiporter [Eubacteriales bacterium]
MKIHKLLHILVLSLLLVFSCTGAVFAGEHQSVGELLPIWSIIPFVGMLLSIAIIPLINGEWWEERKPFVVAGWSLAFVIPFALGFGPERAAIQLLETVLLDYVPFLVLIFGLFVVAGGFVLRGTLVGSPKVNIILLLVGTALASWIGTTGASMVMIRPIIRANSWRTKNAHVIIFFIFMVANIGGSLTPIGDPPLFLGFLRGVPFFWTMHLLPLMLFNIAALSVVFLLFDRSYYKKDLAAGNMPPDTKDDKMAKEPLRVDGLHNVVFLLMIIGAVILSGVLAGMPAFADQATGHLLGVHIYDEVSMPYTYLIQIAIILLAAFLSTKTTKKEFRKANNFTYDAIVEVGTLFIGIFITMIPALAILNARGAELGLDQPWQFFWVTGALSSFLDNAPTYLVFMTTAASLNLP